jgi:hypothetical protein
MKSRRFGLFLCALLLATPALRAVSTYTCTVVPINAATTGFPSVFPLSINNQRQIGGYIAGPNFGFVADETGASVPYATPSGTVIQAAVNSKGQVAGWTGDTRSPWYPFTGGPNGLQPAQGFLSNSDGSVLTLDPPPDSPTRRYGDIRVSSINDSGDILGEIGVIDQGQPLTQYWFIRGADGIYSLFHPHGSGPGRSIFRGNIIDTPAGFMNSSRTAVLNNVLRNPDGSETPITFRGSSAYPWTWWGISNNGSILGTFDGFRYNPPFSVLRLPDGHAPAVVCPAHTPDRVLASSMNDEGVIAGALQSGSSVVFLHPTGVHAAVTLSNTSWGFSPNPVGQQGGSGIVYLTNYGAADLNIESVAMSARDTGDSPGDFSITKDGTTCVNLIDIGGGTLATLPNTVAPGGFCTVSFTFTPRGVGSRTADLVIFDDAPDAPHIVRVDGTGLGKQNLIFSNSSWMAGAHPVGQTAGPATIYIYNPGTDSIDIASIAFSGANATDFSAVQSNCDGTIAPYTTCFVSFTFTPGAAGLRAAVLTVSDNSPVRQQSIPISGYGF